MNKQDLLDQEIFTVEEMQEYEDLLVLEKYYLLINEQIDIEIDKEPKNYYFDKGRGKFRVRFLIDGSFKSFGSYTLESDAKDRVNTVRKELGLWAIY